MSSLCKKDGLSNNWNEEYKEEEYKDEDNGLIKPWRVIRTNPLITKDSKRTQQSYLLSSILNSKKMLPSILYKETRCKKKWMHYPHPSYLKRYFISLQDMQEIGLNAVGNEIVPNVDVQLEIWNGKTTMSINGLIQFRIRKMAKLFVLNAKVVS